MTWPFTTTDTNFLTYEASDEGVTAGRGAMCVKNGLLSSVRSFNMLQILLSKRPKQEFMIFRLYFHSCVCVCFLSLPFPCEPHIPKCTAKVNQQFLWPSCPIKIPYSSGAAPPCVVHRLFQPSSLTSYLNWFPPPLE